MTDLTAEAAIEMLAKLDAEMTPGPWRKGVDDPNEGLTPCVFAGDAKEGPYIADCTWDGRGPQQNADAAGIAALRNALPALRRLIESQAATIQRQGEALARADELADAVKLLREWPCPNYRDKVDAAKHHYMTVRSKAAPPLESPAENGGGA